MAINSYDKFRKKIIVPLIQTLGKSQTINSQTIIVDALDGSGNVLRCHGTPTITDNGAGYAKGCIYVDTDTTSGSQSLFTNIGSSTTCQFVQMGTSVAPTYVVKYAGSSQVAAAVTGTTIVVTGVLGTDLAFAQFQGVNLTTNTVALAKASNNGVVMVFSGLVSATSVVTYQVLRSVS